MEKIKEPETIPLYGAASAETTRDYALRKIDIEGVGRFYQLPEGDEILPSVTTILSILPKSDGFTYLRDTMGAYKFEQMMSEKALYGTCLHIALQRFFCNRRYDFSQTEAIVIENKGKTAWVNDLNFDFASIAKWAQDRKVIPAFVEMQFFNEDYAGTIDLIGTMEIEKTRLSDTDFYKSGDKKGLPKTEKYFERVEFICDFKSGKSGFRPEHELQLVMYAGLVTGMGDALLVNVAPATAKNGELRYKEKIYEPNKNARLIAQKTMGLFKALHAETIFEQAQKFDFTRLNTHYEI